MTSKPSVSIKSASLRRRKVDLARVGCKLSDMMDSQKEGHHARERGRDSTGLEDKTNGRGTSCHDPTMSETRSRGHGRVSVASTNQEVITYSKSDHSNAHYTKTCDHLLDHRAIAVIATTLTGTSVIACRSPLYIYDWLVTHLV